MRWRSGASSLMLPVVLTVYERPGCMFCVRMRMLLEQEGIPFELHTLTDEASKAAAKQKHGWSTFPIVVAADGTTIGGFTEAASLHRRGQLRPKT